MPAALLKSFSEKTGKSLKRIEHLWKIATKAAKRQGHDGEYDYMVGTLKRMLGLTESMMIFSDLNEFVLINESSDDIKSNEDPRIEEICETHGFEPSDVKTEILFGIDAELERQGVDADVGEIENQVIDNILKNPLHYSEEVGTALQERYLDYIVEAGRVVGQLPIKGVTRKNPARVNPQDMKPGGIYNYDYTSKMYKDGELAFYDAKPFILCVAPDPKKPRPKLLFGVNFNYLPKNVRTASFNALKKRFPKEFEKNSLFPLAYMQWEQLKQILPAAKYVTKAYLKNRIKLPVLVDKNEAYDSRALDTSAFFAISAKEVHDKWKESAKMQRDPVRIEKVHGGPKEPGNYRV